VQIPALEGINIRKKETKAKQDDAAAKVQALYRAQAPASADAYAAPASADAYAAPETSQQQKDEAAAKVQELYRQNQAEY